MDKFEFCRTQVRWWSTHMCGYAWTKSSNQEDQAPDADSWWPDFRPQRIHCFQQVGLIQCLSPTGTGRRKQTSHNIHNSCGTETLQTPSFRSQCCSRNFPKRHSQDAVWHPGSEESLWWYHHLWKNSSGWYKQSCNPEAAGRKRRQAESGEMQDFCARTHIFRTRLQLWWYQTLSTKDSSHCQHWVTYNGQWSPIIPGNDPIHRPFHPKLLVLDGAVTATHKERRSLDMGKTGRDCISGSEAGPGRCRCHGLLQPQQTHRGPGRHKPSGCCCQTHAGRTCNLLLQPCPDGNWTEIFTDWLWNVSSYLRRQTFSHVCIRCRIWCHHRSQTTAWNHQKPKANNSTHREMETDWCPTTSCWDTALGRTKTTQLISSVVIQPCSQEKTMQVKPTFTTLQRMRCQSRWLWKKSKQKRRCNDEETCQGDPNWPVEQRRGTSRLRQDQEWTFHCMWCHSSWPQTGHPQIAATKSGGHLSCIPPRNRQDETTDQGKGVVSWHRQASRAHSQVLRSLFVFCSQTCPAWTSVHDPAPFWPMDRSCSRFRQSIPIWWIFSCCSWWIQQISRSWCHLLALRQNSDSSSWNNLCSPWHTTDCQDWQWPSLQWTWIQIIQWRVSLPSSESNSALARGKWRSWKVPPDNQQAHTHSHGWECELESPTPIVPYALPCNPP